MCFHLPFRLPVKLSKGLREKLGNVVDRVQSWVDEARQDPNSPDELLKSNQTVHRLFSNDTSVIKSKVNLGDTETSKTSARPTASTPTLHVSLSHPLPLRAFQIPLLLDHMRRPTGIGGGPLRVGLEGGFRAYTNGTQSEGDEHMREDDEEEGAVEREGRSVLGKSVLEDLGRSGMGKKSRGFLALKVGVGHDKVRTEDTSSRTGCYISC